MDIIVVGLTAAVVAYFVIVFLQDLEDKVNGKRDMK